MVTKYNYDDMKHMVKKTVGTDATEYTYGKKGLLFTVTDISGTFKYQYDRYNRLTKQTNVNVITLFYAYDKQGVYPALAMLLKIPTMNRPA